MQIVLTEWLNEQTTTNEIPIPFFADSEEAKKAVGSPLCVVEDAFYRVQLDTEGEVISRASLYIGADSADSVGEVYSNRGLSDMLDATNLRKSLSRDRLFIGEIDILRLRLEVEYLDGRRVVLYSPEIYCGFSSEKEEQNICHIVRSLLEFDDVRVNNILYNAQSPIHPLFNKESPNSYYPLKEYINFIQRVVETYWRHAPYFRHKAHCRVSQHESIVPMEEVRQIAPNSVAWLAQNSESLTKSSSQTGIRIEGSHYYARKMQSLSKNNNYDVYENRLICSFLKVVRSRADQLYASGLCNLTDVQGKIESLKEIRPGIRIPFLTIQQYACERFAGDLAKLKSLISEVDKLYLNYTSFLHCKDLLQLKDVPPRATLVLLQNPVYHEIFKLIIRWCRYGELHLAGTNLVFKVENAARLFEYYCLQRLLQKIIEEGYKPVEEALSFYTYVKPYSSFSSNQKVNNTFTFSRGKLKLTLYYAPVIYNYMPKRIENQPHTMPNGLTLYRTSGQVRNYWEPDFVLRVEDAGRSHYVILDAKYAFNSSIQPDQKKGYSSGALDMVVQKYYLNTAAFRGDRICMVWTLQGRVSGTFFYRNEASQLLSKYGADHSFGNCPVNTDASIDKLGRLWQEICNQIEVMNDNLHQEVGGTDDILPVEGRPSKEERSFVSTEMIERQQEDKEPLELKDESQPVAGKEAVLTNDIPKPKLPAVYKNFWQQFLTIASSKDDGHLFHKRVAPSKAQYDNIMVRKNCYDIGLELEVETQRLIARVSPNKKKRTPFALFWKRLKSQREKVENELCRELKNGKFVSFEWKDYRSEGDFKMLCLFPQFWREDKRKDACEWLIAASLAMNKCFSCYTR